jgi:hypothetical protein
LLQGLLKLKQLTLHRNPLAGLGEDAYKEQQEKQEKEGGGVVGEELDAASLKKAFKQNKLYNHWMKRWFPELVLRDGKRKMDKRRHDHDPEEEKRMKVCVRPIRAHIIPAHNCCSNIDAVGGAGEAEEETGEEGGGEGEEGEEGEEGGSRGEGGGGGEERGQGEIEGQEGQEGGSS